MKKLIEKFMIYTIAVGVGLYFLPGTEFNEYYSILTFALILFFINLFLMPLLLVLTLPFNMITFGLASIVANALMILLVDKILPLATVGGFWNAVVIGLMIVVMREGLYVIRMKNRKIVGNE